MCRTGVADHRAAQLLDPIRIVAHFHEQARWCRALGSPFTADLLTCFADDFEARGPIHALCVNWPGNPRKDALGLRLCGALHYAVLAGDAPDLAARYPAASPTWSMAAIWPLARAWLQANHDAVTKFIQSPPQTNETRRSIILLPGFLDIATRFNQPLHLLELGASAGLNQNWDRFSYTTEQWQRPGSSAVSLSTDWRGPPPPHIDAQIEIGSRSACDLNPIDLTQAHKRLQLKSYTWPDQAERLARLDAAIELARETQVKVDKANAVDWLAAKLAVRPKYGVTVIYHSVFLIYPPRDQIAQIMAMIAKAGAEATQDAPIAWLCYESEALFEGDRDSPKMLARLQIWPEGTSQVYASSDGHVTYVDMLDPVTVPEHNR